MLNQLARHYAVSDAWFASVPSQTNCNRAFSLCGTSNGLVNNGELEPDPRAKPLEQVLGMNIGDDRFNTDTIFNALAAAGIDWAVFWQTSYLPRKLTTLIRELPNLIAVVKVTNPLLGAALAGLLIRLLPYAEYLCELSSGELDSCYTWRLFPRINQKISDAARHFQGMEEFHRRARAGTLPKFSYLEPFWTIADETV